MGTKSKQRNLRVSKGAKRYTMMDGKRLRVPLLMGNTPRISGTRTGKDKEFLRGNDGKLSKLQHIIA